MIVIPGCALARARNDEREKVICLSSPIHKNIPVHF
jgi:hypothetical protein